MAEEYLNLPFTDLKRFRFQSDRLSIRHEGKGETGNEILFQFQAGIMVRILDLREVSEGEARVSMPGKKLMLTCKLRGNSEISLDGIASSTLNEGQLIVAYNVDDMDLREFSKSCDRYLLVMLICDPEVFVQDPFDLSIDQLPNCIEQAIAGTHWVNESFSMSNDLTRALYILLEGVNDPVWSRPFLQAKTVEIACLAMRNILNEESRRKFSQVTEKEIGIVSKAADLLSTEWREPPTLPDMVKQLGLGKSRLTSCFKIIYGCTMSDYVLNLRMQHAQQLLSERKLNITQVALEIGYEHPSNFTSAFKRFTGMTPKHFQKNSLSQHLDQD
ncbi:helix-turn-helix transcriptional regulator [Pseudoteredinibacter isoporae]|uniref:AraC-like DNA-binding protein n=1 Tax=Pseudoteredinibacter isoporae TaxID=570281 RepID=A0A7X0JS26_9GAMM|nr:AraC family transcriptional regulator [Pseudoteredinibacter isoporae]MBB6521262.1 AraC-like DNA-binding protein [Pseudoteredinibacter isoporae]NHO86820.1 helix-turn-helix transcriptional regulator [Pseudoteredinibacter isoporae]NIB24728.1 helix-turn-helix transcriptional regulator [Pseudoteredinibacter isoporae]